MDIWTLAAFYEHQSFENGHKMPWRRAENKVLLLFAGDCPPRHLQSLFCWSTISVIPHFSVPRPKAGTSSCRHSSFAMHIDMLRRTTVGWASHWRVSLHGHTWDLRTKSTKSAQRSNTYVTSCTWTMRSVLSRTLLPPPPLPPPPEPPQAMTSVGTCLLHKIKVETCTN